MKNYLAFLGLVLASSLAFAACGDDDDDNPGTQGKGGSGGSGGGQSGSGATSGSGGSAGGTQGAGGGGAGGSAGSGGGAGTGGSAGTGGGGAGAGGSGGGTLPPFTLPALCKNPESVFYDAATKAWYVSCQEGTVAGDGYVAKLADDGKSVTTQKYVAGLNDPKGIRINGTRLFVSDVDALVTVDLSDPANPGAPVRTSVVGVGGADAIPAADLFLNDVAVDPADGKIYVSDTPNNALFRFEADGTGPVLVVKDPQIEAPNGLLVRGDSLLIAAFGPGIDRDAGFLTDKLGAVIAVPLATVNNLTDGVTLAAGSFAFVSQRVGNLDGIELDTNGDLILTDFFGGRLFTVEPTSDAPGATPGFGQGDAVPLRNGFAQSADHGFDPARRLVAVPETGNGNVQFIDLGP